MSSIDIKRNGRKNLADWYVVEILCNKYHKHNYRRDYVYAHPELIIEKRKEILFKRDLKSKGLAKCSKCGFIGNRKDDFVSGHEQLCKNCKRGIDRRYRERNRDKIKANQHEWYKANRKFPPKYTPKPITQADKDFILSHYQNMTYGKMSEVSGMTTRRLKSIMGNLGLRMPKTIRERKKNVYSKESKRRMVLGATKAGNIKASKSKCRSGTIRIVWSHGRKIKKIKIKDRWQQYHVYLWQKRYGKLPNNWVIYFRDDDSLNCDINNLVAADRTIKWQEASKNLTDNFVAYVIEPINKKLRRVLRTERELLSLKRHNLLLKRELKNQKNAKHI